MKAMQQNIMIWNRNILKKKIDRKIIKNAISKISKIVIVKWIQKLFQFIKIKEADSNLEQAAEELQKAKDLEIVTDPVEQPTPEPTEE